MITHTTFNKAFVEDIRNQRATTIVFERRETIVDQLGGNNLEFTDGDVYLDFSNVAVVNSADLSALIRFRLRMIKIGKVMRVCNIGSVLAEIFEITRFPPKESFDADRASTRQIANHHAARPTELTHGQA